MQKLNDLFISIIFAITLFLIIMFLFLFNPHFMIHELKKYNYYEERYCSLINYLDDLNIKYKLKENDFKMDINNYIKSRYKEYYIGNKIDSNIDLDEIYLSYVKFDGYFKIRHMHILNYILFFVTLLAVIVTGNILIKTKNKHNLANIFVISSSILLISYAILRLLNHIEIDIIIKYINDYLKYLLGISIILFEVGIFIKIKNRLFK